MQFFLLKSVVYFRYHNSLLGVAVLSDGVMESIYSGPPQKNGQKLTANFPPKIVKVGHNLVMWIIY